jgi:hypothetical protein
VNERNSRRKFSAKMMRSKVPWCPSIISPVNHRERAESQIAYRSTNITLRWSVNSDFSGRRASLEKNRPLATHNSCRFAQLSARSHLVITFDLPTFSRKHSMCYIVHVRVAVSAQQRSSRHLELSDFSWEALKRVKYRQILLRHLRQNYYLSMITNDELLGDYWCVQLVLHLE